MGRKKFNKKDAAVYHLVRRSQRDVGGYFDEEGKPIDMPSDFVLIPSEDTLKRAEMKKEQHVLSERKKIVNNHHHNHNNDDDDDDDDPLTRARKKLTQANLVDDYDYDKHMKPISDSGVFINNESHASTDYYTHEIRSKKLDLIDPMIKEVDRQFDSIALTADCMDDDVAQALFGDFDEGDFEEILDDFCITANQEEPIHDMYDGRADEEYNGANQSQSTGGILDFDFDAHIDALIAKAKQEENGGPKVVPKGHEAWTQQQNIFQGVKPLKNKKRLDGIDEHSDDDDDDDNDDDDDSLDQEFGHHHGDTHPDYFTMEENPGIVAKLNPEEEKALCDKFEQTLLEYDSDHLGDLDEQCFDIRGDKPLEGDTQIEAALDSFLQQKKDDNFVMGTNTNGPKRAGGSSMVFVNKKLVPYNVIDKVEGDIDNGEGEEKIEDVLAEAEQVLANPEMDLPPEEVLIDGKSYFTMKERNPWDCESILSTYSNLDNNPAVVGRSGRRRKKKKNKNRDGSDFDIESIAEEKPVQILLSNKTGLPLGVLSGPTKDGDDDFGEETYMSVNKGEARKKGESKDEKRARKLLVKQERQIARIQKKMMREAIAEEFGQRTRNDVSNEVGGKSVFKYS